MKSKSHARKTHPEKVSLPIADHPTHGPEDFVLDVHCDRHGGPYLRCARKGEPEIGTPEWEAATHEELDSYVAFVVMDRRALYEAAKQIIATYEAAKRYTARVCREVAR